MRALRIAALLLAAAGLAVYVRALPVWMSAWTNSEHAAGAAASGIPWALFAGAILSTGIAASAAPQAAALLILARTRASRYAIVVALALAFFGFGVTDALGVLAREQPEWSTAALAVGNVANALALIVLLTFPDGRFRPAWIAVLALMWTSYLAVMLVVPSLRWSQILIVTQLVLFGFALATQAYRYRTWSTPEDRVRTNWIVWALIVAFPAAVARDVPPWIWPELSDATRPESVAYVAFAQLYWHLAAVAIAFAFAVASVRHHLLDVDLVINRTLVYTAVTAVLAGTFGGLSALTNRVFIEISGQRSDVAVGLAAIVVALMFLPVRWAAQRMVDGAMPGREIVTLLFTDVVDSSPRAAELGDEKWRKLLSRYREIVRRQLDRYGGREIDNEGDGFFATFDTPTAAVRCARSIAAAVREIGLEVRNGVHTGECELAGGKVSGINVHTGARLLTLASPGEVIVSETVRVLAAGAGLTFGDRGTHELKGIPGSWHVYAATE